MDGTIAAAMPESAYKSGFEVLAEDFSAGMELPVRIVIGGDATDPAVVANVDALVSTLSENDRLGAISSEVSPDGMLTVVDAITRADPLSTEAEEIVSQLRDETVPAGFGDDAGRVFVTGATADTMDFDAALVESLPLVFTFVIGLSFMLLLVAFRSVLVQVTSILMNMLSFGATSGAEVAVFQFGF